MPLHALAGRAREGRARTEDFLKLAARVRFGIHCPAVVCFIDHERGFAVRFVAVKAADEVILRQPLLVAL
jgi:hypothetical protein